MTNEQMSDNMLTVMSIEEAIFYATQAIKIYQKPVFNGSNLEWWTCILRNLKTKLIEDYYKYKINEISDEHIKSKKFLMSDGGESNNAAYKLGSQTGMKWLKNQLLKK